MAQMVSCEELWDLLSAYADGMTTRDEATRVERHIVICPECARDLRFMQETAHVLADAPEVAPPASLRDSILAATIYRPTWQQRAREAARRLVPTSPLRAMAFAGSAAAILLAAYVSVTRVAPVSDAARTDIASAPKPTPVHTPLPGSSQSALARNDAPKVSPAAPVSKPAPNEKATPEPGVTGPRIVQASSRLREDQALRARAEQALLARADSAIRGFGRRGGSRANVASNRPHVNELIPNLQPERVEQPRENLPEMTIDTADMTMPMTAANTNPPMSPRDSSVGPVAPPTTPVVERPRITLAAVTTNGSAAPTSMVTLADLRRQLRRNNIEASEVMHPELHLRSRRETLDVVKSSF